MTGTVSTEATSEGLFGSGLSPSVPARLDLDEHGIARNLVVERVVIADR